MTRQQWESELYPLIAKTAKIDPLHAEFHPAYRGALRKIDSLIEVGLQHEYLTPEAAARL